MTAICSTAHRLEDKWRSKDIKLQEELDFSALLLSDLVQIGLTKSGFIKPSPIQLKAIPLGKSGLDLIVQAKSGTGKTCIFVVIALENVMLESPSTQTLILAPTREIAYQICEVVTSIGSALPGLCCHCFIGGLPISKDKLKLKRCHIAIGTPGRIKKLIESNYLKTNSIRLFVLDEADKLLDDNFQKCINWIYKKLPHNKQMIALSATYPEELAKLLTHYMRNPAFVRLNVHKPALIGVVQFYKVTMFHPLSHIAFQHKIQVLLDILRCVPFSQCLVFINLQMRAQSLCDVLKKHGWLALFISGNQNQLQRLAIMARLKSFQCRILVTTDLTARGIDCENVNLVVNIDLPYDLETYFHRIGRAGRYGSQGIGVTIISEGEEKEKLFKMKDAAFLDIYDLPTNLSADIWKYNIIQDNKYNENENENNIYICKDDDFNNSETCSERSSKIETCSDELQELNNNFNVKMELLNDEHKNDDIFSDNFQCLNTEGENLTDNSSIHYNIKEIVQNHHLKNDALDSYKGNGDHYSDKEKQDEEFPSNKVECFTDNQKTIDCFPASKSDEIFNISESVELDDIMLFFKTTVKNEIISYENSLKILNDSSDNYSASANEDFDYTLLSSDYLPRVSLFLEDINSKYWRHVTNKQDDITKNVDKKEDNASIDNCKSLNYPQINEKLEIIDSVQIKNICEITLLEKNQISETNGKLDLLLDLSSSVNEDKNYETVCYEDKCVCTQETDISSNEDSQSSLGSFALCGKFSETSESCENLAFSYDSQSYSSSESLDNFQMEHTVLIDKVRENENQSSDSGSTKSDKQEIKSPKVANIESSTERQEFFEHYYDANCQDSKENFNHLEKQENVQNYSNWYSEYYHHNFNYIPCCCNFHRYRKGCTCCGANFQNQRQFQEEWIRQYQYYMSQMLQWRRIQKCRKCCCKC